MLGAASWPAAGFQPRLPGHGRPLQVACRGLGQVAEHRVDDVATGSVERRRQLITQSRMQHRLLSFVCILTSVDRATTPPDPRAVKIIATRTDAQRLCVRSVRLNWVSNS